MDRRPSSAADRPRHQVTSILLLAAALIGRAAGSFTSEDFQVYTRTVLLTTHSGELDAQFRTLERYSAALGRGQLHLEQWLSFEGASRPGRRHASYFSSGSLEPGKLLRTAVGDLGCKQVGSVELLRELFGERLVKEHAELEGLFDLLPRSETNGHLFGMARLLVLFDQSRDRFSLVRQPMVSTHKNVIVDLYSLDFPLAEGAGTLVIKALVPAKGRSADEVQVGSRNPMRMMLRFPSHLELVIDFDRIGHVRPAPTNSMFQRLDQRASAGHQDESPSKWATEKLFNLPIGRGCTRSMDSTRSAPRNPLRHPEEIYSFKFELIKMANLAGSSSSRVQSAFVAYDGLTGALRIEPVRVESGQMELTIHDLNLGLKFHVSGGDNSASLSRAELEGGREQKTSFCTKTKLSKLELLPCEPILPLSQLVYMGAGEVRGIESAIYETTAKRLPRMIFQSVTWLDQNQNEESKFELYSRKDKSKEQPASGALYTLVYHLAADYNDAKSARLEEQQLLRIDIYDSESQHRFRVELFDFQWRLSEAPNGDPQHQLFTLSQRCQFAGSQSHLMKLNLELLRDASSQVIDQLTLRHPSKRNTELIRGLVSASLSISAGQIVELSSRADEHVDTKSPTRLLVELTILPAHIVNGPPLLTARAIGTGMVTDVGAHSLHSDTLSACFWEASRWARPKWDASSELSATPQSGTVFSFCFTRCWIDSEAQLRRAPKTTLLVGKMAKDPVPQLSSKAFFVSQASDRVLPCQLFLIEQQVAVRDLTAAAKPMEFLLEELSLQLANKKFEVAGTSFKLARVNTARDPSQQLNSHPQLKGLAFVATPTSANSTSEAIVWVANLKLVSPESCRALCVAGAACRSYSVCLAPNGQVECLLSSVDVRQLDFLSELRSKLERSKRDKTVRIAVSAGPVALELRVSKRCQIHAKQAKDLFRQIETDQTRPSRLYLNSLKSVASQEQCAELCLRKNSGYFRRLAKFQVEIEAPPSGPTDSDSEQLEPSTAMVKPKELHEQHLDTMLYWCDRYKYLFLTPATINAAKLRDQLKGTNSSELKEKLNTPGSVGLCFLARGRWTRSDVAGEKKGPGSKPAESVPLIRIKMDTFEFRYSQLYQRQDGFRLTGVKSGRRSEPAEQVASDRSEIHWRNAQTIEERPTSVEFCARQCFTQAVQWCRSFDLVRFDKVFYCIYNSLAYNEALSLAGARQLGNQSAAGPERLVLERPANNSRARFFHFEPIEAYPLDLVKLKVAGDFDSEGAGEAPSSSSGLFRSRRVFWVLAGGLLFVLLAALILIKTKRDRDEGPMIPQVNLARLSFSLPVGVAANSKLLSQDQLELQHNAQEAAHQSRSGVES